MKHHIISLTLIASIFAASLVQAEPKPSEPPRAKLTVHDAFEAFIEAKGAFYKAKYDRALKLFHKAEAIYRDNLSTLTKGEQLFDTHQFIALIHFSQKKTELAKKELKSAYLLNSKRMLDPKIYPPNFIKFVKKEFKNLETLPKSRLEITSTPPFAIVYVNGSKMGLTPIILKDWPSGEHHIIVSIGEYKGWHSVIKTDPKGLHRIKADLAPLANPSWITKSPISKAPKKTDDEIVKFINTVNEKGKSNRSWAKSPWFLSLAALVIGGISFGVVQSQRNKGSSSQRNPSHIVTKLP